MKKTTRKVGSSWKGEDYIHGPRKIDPKLFTKFRLGKPTKKGVRLVLGYTPKTKKWGIQSKLTPRRKKMKTKVIAHTRKTKKGKKVQVKTYFKKCPGSKIRSKGKGRGLGIGQARGPIGIPRYNLGSHPVTGEITSKEAERLLFESTSGKPKKDYREKPDEPTSQSPLRLRRDLK